MRRCEDAMLRKPTKYLQAQCHEDAKMRCCEAARHRLCPPSATELYSGVCSQCLLFVRLCVMCCIIIGGKTQHIQSTFNDINRAIMWFCPLVALSANLTFTANLKKSNSNIKDIMAALECGVEGSGEKSSIEYCRYY